MNKARVNSYLPIAVKVLRECEIADQEGVIDGTYRANISGFGAAVIMGSFKSAVAFYSEDARDKGETKSDDNKVMRSKLIEAMYRVVHGVVHGESKSAKAICRDVISINKPSELKLECDKWIDASVALKLAMNTYVINRDKDE